MSRILHLYDVAEDTERDLSAQEAVRLAQKDKSLILISGVRDMSPRTFHLIASSVARRKLERAQERIDAMIDAYLDTDAFDQVEAKIDDDNARLRAEFLSDFEVLTSAQIHAMSGSTSRNKSATANDWKKAGKIFSVKLQGKDLYPAFQFNADGRPYATLADVLAALPQDLTSWQTAFWLVAPQNALDGARPIDLVQAGDARVFDAAARAFETPAG